MPSVTVLNPVIKTSVYSKNNDNIHYYNYSILRKIPVDIGDGSKKNICVIGDSLTDSGLGVKEMYDLLKEDNDFEINLIGTETDVISGFTVRHEGKNGWTYNAFANTSTFNNFQNPFMYDNSLNFKRYMADNFNNEPLDYFVICLGTNDVDHGHSLASYKDIENIINNAKKFIEALISEETGYPDCKVAIGLPSPGNPYFSGGYYNPKIFHRNIQKLNRSLIDTFDNGKYHSNVTCVMHGAYIDRYGSFGKSESNVSQYSSTKGIVGTNDMHPNVAGYKSFGRGYYAKIRAFMAGEI